MLFFNFLWEVFSEDFVILKLGQSVKLKECSYFKKTYQSEQIVPYSLEYWQSDFFYKVVLYDH